MFMELRVFRGAGTNNNQQLLYQVEKQTWSRATHLSWISQITQGGAQLYSWLDRRWWVSCLSLYHRIIPFEDLAVALHCDQPEVGAGL